MRVLERCIESYNDFGAYVRHCLHNCKQIESFEKKVIDVQIMLVVYLFSLILFQNFEVVEKS